MPQEFSAGGVLSEADDDAAVAEPGSLGLKERVESFERGLIADELQRCGGNRSEAARRMGIGRVTLLEKMKKYGIK